MAAGQAATARVASPHERLLRAASRRAQPGTRIHWARTLAGKGADALTTAHLRFHPRRDGGAMLYCLVLDCSASMLRGQTLAKAKGLLLRWVQQLYRQRAELAVIGFSGAGARLLQPPHKAVAFNERWIGAIGGGGGTPAAAGIALASRLARDTRRRAPHRPIGVWLLTDGRFDETPPPPADADLRVIIDFEHADVPLGRARRLAEAWQADYLHADEVLAHDDQAKPDSPPAPAIR